ncbi:Mitochondrial inner membrane translocase subunit Tim17/Tim22/Tim23/peroxisomal protein PMP24 [Corchorus olitorius]|uniref:Mitochondrial inner membrane translocase subunit Tim17/Tim22/Tim23/peroxisomal protein PMP24 n=1 Tax=Corchorus olitorius TaxID=93759 RepID=A0A1R3GK10_9ROSI|nr:Mitochondrial inner membrane translocase subunit Tim17/Tim22/Tim23/peroxisomal protein PMP24 [Corchorus olitorius]
MITTKSNLETRSLLDEWRSFDNGCFFDFGHPLLNRIAESFIGAVQAVARDACCAGTETGLTGAKKHRMPRLSGETNQKSLEAMVKRAGKESVQWGVAAGLYSSLTYGLKEARRGSHDWKSSAVAGAITGMALGLTAEGTTQEHVMQCAITGAAISTAANLLTGIF